MTSSSKQRVACIIDLGFRKWIIPFCSRSGYTEAKDLHLFHNHQDSSVVFKSEGKKKNVGGFSFSCVLICLQDLISHPPPSRVINFQTNCWGWYHVGSKPGRSFLGASSASGGWAISLQQPEAGDWSERFSEAQVVTWLARHVTTQHASPFFPPVQCS